MTDREFAGKPIRGDYAPNSIFEKEQSPLEDLISLMDRLLALPGVKSLSWNQCTPYFNDGDTCVFGANGWSLSVVVDHNGEEIRFGEDGDKNFEDYAPGWGYSEAPSIDWKERDLHRTTIHDGIDYTRHDEIADEVVKAIDSGSYDKDLLKYFGDHAEVSYDGAGFDIEYFDHE